MKRIVYLVLIICLMANGIEVSNLPCKLTESVNINDGIRNPNGSITFDDLNYDLGLYGRSEYDENSTYIGLHLRGCPCLITVCVHLCCPRNHVKEDLYCVDHYKFPSFEVINNFKEANDTVQLHKDVAVVYGKPCESTFQLEDHEEWILNKNGTLFSAIDDLILPRNEFCISPAFIDSNMKWTAYMCFTQEITEKSNSMIIKAIAMGASVPFFILTFFVYAILPDQRNLHGKSFMCYIAGLAIAYAMLSLITLIEIKDPFFCKLSGYIIYTAFMFAFFWLSVISFDLWWNFRGISSLSKSAARKKFYWYSLYAWGLTIIISGLVLIFDHTEIIDEQMRPGIGHDSCFLREFHHVKFYYLYLPIILIICLNSTFFGLTSYKIYLVQREMARMMAKDDSRRNQNNLDNDKKNFGLYLRLFIVMGVTWSLELISYAVLVYSSVDYTDREKIDWIFILSDICNGLQGLLVFILFVMKPKVWMSLKKRWYVFRGKSMPQSSTYRSSRSSCTTNITMAPMAEKSLLDTHK